MHIEIDIVACKAYANCTFEAPAVFEVDDTTGKARVILDVVTQDRRDEVERAAEACPVQAILVKD